MLYAKIENGEVVAYPYSLADFYADHPNVSNVQHLDTDELAELGTARVVGTAIPVFDDLTHEAAEGPPIYNAEAERWQQTWAAVELSEEDATAKRQAAIASALLKIDRDGDAMREAVLGSRTTEYQEAYADALAFQAAGYAGAVPSGVATWFAAKTAVGAGWTAQQCADDIIATGEAWIAAQQAIRSNRLLRKEQVRVATTRVGIDAPLAGWAAFVTYMRVQLGLAD